MTTGQLTRRDALRRLGGGVACSAATALLAACVPVAPSQTAQAPQPTQATKPTAVAATGVQPTQSQQAAPVTSRPLDVVKRGNLRGITFGAAIAKARGYFQESGIDDQETVFSNGAEQAQALAVGSIEVGNSSSGSAFFNSVARGVNQPMVCDNWHLERGDNSYMVVVRPDLADSVKTVTDLKGKVNSASTPRKDGGSYFQTKKMFEANGMDIDDVQWEQLTFPNMLAALGSKKIDVAWIIEPFITLGKQQNLMVPVLNLGDHDPGAQIAATIYSERFIKERPDVAKRWMVANLRGTRDYAEFRKGNLRDVVGPILAQHTGLAPALIEQVGWPAYDPNGQLHVQSIMDAQKQLQEWGGVTQLLPVEQVIDVQFADNAVRELGRYSG